MQIRKWNYVLVQYYMKTVHNDIPDAVWHCVSMQIYIAQLGSGS